LGYCDTNKPIRFTPLGVANFEANYISLKWLMQKTIFGDVLKTSQNLQFLFQRKNQVPSKKLVIFTIS